MTEKKEKKDNKTEPKRVITRDGIIPFSVGYLANTLLSIGIKEEKAIRDAHKISMRLKSLKGEEFTSKEIMDIACEYYEERNPNLAMRLKIVSNHLDIIRPLVILLGGVTGIGKSTIAQLLGSRLGINTVMGTDYIREILRITISKNLMPSLHVSTYLAHEKLNTSFMPSLSKVVVGFEEQVRMVTVGIEAAIQQAISDNDFTIIEGIHVVPGIIDPNIINQPNIIYLQLKLEDEKTHYSRLKKREKENTSRGVNYLQYFKEIREIQNYMIDRAKEFNVPLIEVSTNEKAVRKILGHIWDHVQNNLLEKIDNKLLDRFTNNSSDDHDK